MLSASFQIEEAGLTHFVPPPAAPAPEESFFTNNMLDGLPQAARERYVGFLRSIAPIETRATDLRRLGPGAALVKDPKAVLWIRIAPELPDDPALHRAALVYLSDMTLLNTALGAHGHSVGDGSHQVASLDHAFWFNRPARADQWLLYVQESPQTGGARGLTRGSLYDGAGVMVASVAQEGLMRPVTAKS